MEDTLRSLAALLARRAETAPSPEGAADANRLRRHIEEFLIPRAIDLDAPLLVVILGSTGSGKSSLFNTLAAEPISDVGVLRPTTRLAQVLASPSQTLPTAVSALEVEGLADVTRRPSGRNHVVLVDAPDVDSIEAANRELAQRLLETADLVIFVTTDIRYADEMPWEILRRARRRGVPLLTVINRLPSTEDDRSAVLDDYRRLLEEEGVHLVELVPGTGLTGVSLGDLDESGTGLNATAIAPVAKALQRLVDDDAGRRALVESSLEAALSELPARVGQIVAAIDEEVAGRGRLLAIAADNYEESKESIGRRMDRGSFLRSEVLREWQDYVGAGKVARVIAEGVGKIAATVRSLFQADPPAAAGEVREAALADLTALVVNQAEQAAAETAASWARSDYGSAALENRSELLAADPDLASRLEDGLSRWAGETATDIMEIGEQRRSVAKAASLGVNVVGTGAILAVFAHTGGLTGAEAGIAAATAVINQSLLEALFGEANVARFVNNARQRLDGLIAGLLDDDRDRYEAALPISAESEDLAASIRSTLEMLGR